MDNSNVTQLHPKDKNQKELTLEQDTIVIIQDQDIKLDIGAVESGKVKRFIRKSSR